MNNARYAKLIRYKVALDNAWKRRDPSSIFCDGEYERTLQIVKADEFKVLRNSKGEHKLVDILEEGKVDFTDACNILFGNIFNK